MRRTTIGLAVAALVLSACGGGDDDSDGSDQPAFEPAAGEPADQPSDEPADQPSDEPADQPSDEPAAEPADEPAVEEGASSDQATDAPPATGLTENTAVVVIGENVYTFDVTPTAVQRCDPNFFGAFWVLGRDAAGNGIELLLPPPNDPNFEDPPTAKIGDEAADIEWVANSDPEFPIAGVEAGDSQVDAFTVDGRYVSGTATFVDLNASYLFQGGGGPAPTPVTGTFEVLCGEE